jgi:D-proline reductase (dithiol) PrdB
MCHQSVGLIARALEMEGIATVIVAWNGGRVRLLAAPRLLITRLVRGTVFGRPGDAAQQCRVLETALSLLEKEAPLEPVTIQESIE